MASTRRGAAAGVAVASTTTTTTTPSSSKTNPYRHSLLQHLALSALSSSPSTALFWAERLFALESTTEHSLFLLATALVVNSHPHQAIHLLRQPIHFHPVPDPLSRYSTTTRISRPAIQASVRCARLYAQQCSLLGRDKEGRQVLATILQPATPLSPQQPLDIPPLTTTLASTLFASTAAPSPADNSDPILQLELARLAHKAGEHERAIQSYSQVLQSNPWCWEALTGLCAQGAPPDPDALYPPRPRPPTTSTTTTTTAASNTPTTATAIAPISPLPNRSQPHPPPLGPSQTSAVNSSFSFSGGAGNKGMGVGFFTPSDTASPVLGGGVAKGKDKFGLGGGGLFGVGGGGGGAAGGSIWRRAVARGPDVSEMSIDDSSSSFETSFYPPAPLSFGVPLPTTSTSASSSSLFTPPTAPSLSTSAPGVKRTRGGTSSSNLTPSTDDNPPPPNGRRVVRGVPSEGVATKGRRDTSVAPPPPTRRSSRLSRDAGGSRDSMGGGSSGMSLSKSQQSATSTSTSVTGGGVATRSTKEQQREKKRSKAGAGPSVLSDAGGSDILSPTSHSSSPAPSSPGATNFNAPLHPLALPSSSSTPSISPADSLLITEAEDYIVHLLRCFAQGVCWAAKFQGEKSVQAYLSLPQEQLKTWRAMVGVAEGWMERLEYEKAEKAFLTARSLSPHLLTSMSTYSTLLWHLRRSTALSYLAQDLMLISPRHPSSWIASGNVFSHLEDHAAALKCFKRAAQLEEDCVYAYTLSGHECVVLEEWERALGFFREAVRRDGRHYNAWFGLGNVYMQTGKYRLAEYHFRKAAEINPTNATLVCCVGSVLEKLGRRKEALELYEKACVLAPQSPAVRFKRVRILIALRQYELAESDLLNLKDRAPNEFNVHFLLGKLYKQMSFTHPAKEKDMLKHFSLAQDLEPRAASLIREQIEREVDTGMDVDEEDGGEAS